MLEFIKAPLEKAAAKFGLDNPSTVGKQEVGKKAVDESIFGRVGNWMYEHLLGGDKKTADKARGIKENAQEERNSIFDNVWVNAILARYYPNISRVKDFKDPRKIYEAIKKDPSNIVNEFDNILTDISFLPDCALHYATDPIRNMDLFKKIVKFYDQGWKGLLTPELQKIPLIGRLFAVPVVGTESQNWYDKIYGKEKYDPHDVMKFIRIVLKDKDAVAEVVKFLAGSASSVAQTVSHFTGDGGTSAKAAA